MTATEFQYIPRSNWIEIFEFDLLDPCAACGYREHDLPDAADTAHDNLCCGSGGDCYWEGDPREFCSTHAPRRPFTLCPNPLSCRCSVREKMNPGHIAVNDARWPR